MMGIVIAPSCVEKFLKDPRLFKFSLSDLERVGPRVKHNLNLLDFSEAQLLSVRARSAPGSGLHANFESWEGVGSSPPSAS